MFKIHVETTGARNALRALSESIESAVRGALYDGIEHARVRAFDSTAFKDRTGELRSSLIAWLDPNPAVTQAELRSNAEQATWIENGTPPHAIAAKRGKFLRFEANGITYFRRRVKHPGIKATHFIEHAVEDEAAPTRDAIAREIHALAERFNR